MDGKELVSGAAYDVYMDIKKRTNGEIYFGVVGPVRTGKSTFIKRFMELCVLPSMKDDNKRKRAQDELPQSSGGTTVMTVEPKFIPSEAALISPFEGINMKVRLVDCVGFMVEGANGHLDNGKERMVKTPWDTKEIAFSKAAEIGTKKVINDHSTIGIVVTTDGSFTEIDRTNYVAAEKKTINELKKINKPFVVILNSDKPYAAKTKELAVNMSADYEVPVIPVNCDQLKNEDVNNILKEVLKQFAVTQIDFFAPEWTQVLPDEHWLKKELMQVAGEVLEGINTIKDADNYKYSADIAEHMGIPASTYEKWTGKSLDLKDNEIFVVYQRERFERNKVGIGYNTKNPLIYIGKARADLWLYIKEVAVPKVQCFTEKFKVVGTEDRILTGVFGSETCEHIIVFSDEYYQKNCTLLFMTNRRT